jgi:acyl-coenzyme A synthetase/AMP-(fatty) acid ligase
MVKRRGYRVELGEIESALLRHPSVAEAAVVALSDGNGDLLIKAFLSTASASRPTVVQMKAFCVEHLPSYMIPDRFIFMETLPNTSTGKVDYRALASTS